MRYLLAKDLGVVTLGLVLCAGCGTSQPVAKNGPAPAAPAVPGQPPGQPPAASGVAPGATTPGNAATTSTPVSSRPIKISAEELCKEIERDPDAAKTKFNQRELIVDGYVYRFGVGKNGIYTDIYLQGAENLVITVILSPGMAARYGQRVTISGSFTYDKMWSPKPQVSLAKLTTSEPYVKPEKPLSYFVSYTSDDFFKAAAEGKDAMEKKLLIRSDLLGGVSIPVLKSIIVEGTVKKVSPPITEGLGLPWEVILSTSKESESVACKFSYDDNLSRLKVGEIATIAGTYDPFSRGPALSNCNVY